MNTSKKTVQITTLSVIALNFLALAVRYICTYHIQNGILSEVSGLLTMITETALPLFAAVAMLAVYAFEQRFKHPLIHNLIYSFSWFIPLFFERFAEYSYSGYEVTYSLLLSLVWGLLMTVAVYAEHTVLFFIIIFASRIFANKRYAKPLSLAEYINSKPAFDFSNPVTVGIFSAAAALFFYNLGTEIANTVSFILSCAGIYTAGEIFYIIFRYVFILALLIFSHYLAHLAKRFFIDR